MATCKGAWTGVALCASDESTGSDDSAAVAAGVFCLCSCPFSSGFEGCDGVAVYESTGWATTAGLSDALAVVSKVLGGTSWEAMGLGLESGLATGEGRAAGGGSEGLLATVTWGICRGAASGKVEPGVTGDSSVTTGPDRMASVGAAVGAVDGGFV